MPALEHTQLKMPPSWRPRLQGPTGPEGRLAVEDGPLRVDIPIPRICWKYYTSPDCSVGLPRLATSPDEHLVPLPLLLMLLQTRIPNDAAVPMPRLGRIYDQL